MTSPVPEYVRELKQQDGRDIGVHGSTSLARSLIAAGLVDVLRLVLTPTIVGRGYQLFPDESDIETQQFELLDVGTSAKGTLFLHYRATGLRGSSR
jgi:dihydrofolate reductase